MIRIVSENSEAEIARNNAREALGWSLRELTANLLRVSRGAGKPYLVGSQAVSIVESFRAYHEAAGVWPSSDEITAMLRLDEDPHYLDRLNERNVNIHYAEVAILRGCMQIAASKLIEQPLQVRRGETEMYQGINELEDIREADRRERAARTPREQKKAARDAFVDALKRSNRKGKKRDD